MDDFAGLVRRQDGVVSRRQALRFVSSKALWGQYHSGKWQIPYRGIYVAHNGPLTPHQQMWVASLAVGCGQPALLGGLTALIVHGLQRFTSPLIHVLCPSYRQIRRPPSGVRVHRTGVMSRSDVCWTSPPCTGPPRSVVDAATWARTDAEARTIIAIAYQQELVQGDEVERVLARMPVVRRRHRLIRDTARDASGGSASLGELDLVALCRDAGLPVPSRQVQRTDASGRPRYLDALFPEYGVRVEVDGAHHMSADQWWQDMARHNDLSRKGEIVLRFPAYLVRERPAEVAEHLRRALREAGWR